MRQMKETTEIRCTYMHTAHTYAPQVLVLEAAGIVGVASGGGGRGAGGAAG